MAVFYAKYAFKKSSSQLITFSTWGCQKGQIITLENGKSIERQTGSGISARKMTQKKREALVSQTHGSDLCI